jgi:hypothetical protein
MARSLSGAPLALAALLASACAADGLPTPPPDPDIGTPGAVLEVRTDAARYPAGGTMKVSLRNDTEGRYWFNVCFDRLERWSGSRWVAAGEPDRACATYVQELAPQGRAEAHYALDRSLRAGAYRLPVRLAAGVTVRSNTFTIEP